MPSRNVLDSTMFFEDRGTGSPIVFLHGNPTSSQLWRNVIPHFSDSWRCLAPDLIGMGKSGKPKSEYRFADHARYLHAWFDALDLQDVVLVGHDWGGALAFDWAARHPDRVRGLAFMETIIRPLTWDEIGTGRERIESFRTPETGEVKVLDQNFFMEVALHATVLNPLSDEVRAIYQAPYQTRESRRPLLEWARSMPVEGEPTDVVERVEAYDRWLASSPGTPKLLVTFDGPADRLMVGPSLVEWCRDNISGLDVADGGRAAHMAPEDQPDNIATAILHWMTQHDLPAHRGEVSPSIQRTIASHAPGPL